MRLRRPQVECSKPGSSHLKHSLVGVEVPHFRIELPGLCHLKVRVGKVQAVLDFSGGMRFLMQETKLDEPVQP